MRVLIQQDASLVSVISQIHEGAVTPSRRHNDLFLSYLLYFLATDYQVVKLRRLRRFAQKQGSLAIDLLQLLNVLQGLLLLSWLSNVEDVKVDMLIGEVTGHGPPPI